MTALQASIGSLNDLVDAPRDAGRKPRQADPGRARVAAAGAGRGRRARPPSGCVLSRPVGRRRRSRWPSSSSRSATPTTSASRAPPGRGSRSRSGSRCCRSTAGSGGRRPAGVLRAPACRSRRGRGRPGHRQRPRRPRARRGGRRRSVARQARARTRLGRPRRPARVVVVGSALVDAGGRSAHRSARWPSAVGAALHRRHRRRARPARRPRPGASGHGSSRRSGSGCSRRRGWPGSSCDSAGRRSAAGRELVPGVVAPDHRDRVLEPELGDRQVLGEVRPVGRADRRRGPRARQDADRAPRRPRPGAAWRRPASRP